MYNVDRSFPEPQSLKTEKIKVSGKYNSEDVLERLVEDFFNKCYLCEEKEISGINVEHLKPHKGDIDKKFQWENLFLVCPHCNNTKLGNEDEILDCTNPSHKIYDWIEYKFTSFPKTKVELKIINNIDIVNNTGILLDKIYNGSTVNKKIEADNIKKKIMREIQSFENLIFEYVYNSKKELVEEIKEKLSRKSAFSAFKRWIIKNNTRYKELEKYFD